MIFYILARQIKSSFIRGIFTFDNCSLHTASMLARMNPLVYWRAQLTLLTPLVLIAVPLCGEVK